MYRFLPGVYTIELFAVLVGRTRPLKLRSVELTLTEMQAARLHDDATAGLYFDWSPETGRYHGHIDNAKLPDPPAMILFPQSPSNEPGRSKHETESPMKTLDK